NFSKRRQLPRAIATMTAAHPHAIQFSAKTIFLSGLLVGSLDILSAFADVYLSSHSNPLKVLNYITSGIMGSDVISHGNAATMMAGLLLHYFIAFSFTVFFFWLCRKTGLLHWNWIIRGICYGIFIWLVMNLVVVQLSRVPHGPISAMKFNRVIKSALILMGMIGLPLSYLVFRQTRHRAAIVPLPGE
ncbi:MAG TPA: hypothetical protein VL307_02910, partial [Chitinophagaceae bacterium]|nr:hypothetical protein [Chitinophagaceae bacterium]